MKIIYFLFTAVLSIYAFTSNAQTGDTTSLPISIPTVVIKTGSPDTLSQKAMMDSLKQFAANININMEPAQAGKTTGLNTMAVSSTAGGAQLSGVQSNVVIPSPNSFSMIDHIATDVQLYTGDFTSNIPLLSLKGKSLQADVTLGYSSNSIKVANPASWVGLGWQLNAGGSITRIVHSLPDEYDGTYSFNNDPLQAYGYLTNGIASKVTTDYFFGQNATERRKMLYYSNFSAKRGVDGVSTPEFWDTEPDEFYFSFGTYSGKFAFGIDGKVNLISDNDNLNISYKMKKYDNVTKIYEFDIVTPDGISYVFGNEDFSNIEESKQYSTGDNITYKYTYIGRDASQGVSMYTSPGYLPFNNTGETSTGIQIFGSETPFFPTTWHLKEIIHPSSEKIRFEYNDASEITYLTDVSQSQNFPNLGYVLDNQSHQAFYVSDYYDAQNKYMTATFSYSGTAQKVKRLTKIISDSGNSIVFVPSSTTREDLIGDKALSSIELRNYEGKKINEFTFNYSYSNSNTGTPEQHTYRLTMQVQPGTTNQYPFLIDPTKPEQVIAEHKRLMLNSIYELNQDAPYTFNYNPKALPRRTSAQQDQWGFFNANDRGTRMPAYNYQTTRIPGVLQTVRTPITWTQEYAPIASYINGGRQLPDQAYTLASLLTDITYPTSGQVHIAYEFKGNDFGGPLVRVITKIPATGKDILEGYVYETPRRVFVPQKAYILYNDLTHPAYGDVSVSSNFIYGPSFTKGSTVGYDAVNVLRSDQTSTRYEFTNLNDYPNEKAKVYAYNAPNATAFTLNTFPFADNIDMDFKRGLIRKETIKGFSNTIRTTEYSYKINPPGYQPVITTGLKAGLVSLVSPIGTNSFLYGAFYTYSSNWYYLESKTVVDYVNNQPKVTNVITYVYDTQKIVNGKNDKLLKEVQQVQSDKTTKINRYYYTWDFNGGSSSPEMTAISTLKSKGMTNTIIREDELRRVSGQDLITKSQFTTYRNNGSLFPQPYKIYQLAVNKYLDAPINIVDNGSVFQLDEKYLEKKELKFDVSNSLVQTINNKSAVQSYQWGYNNTLPTAVVDNTKNQNFFYEGFEASTAGNSAINDSKTGHFSHLGAYSKSLTGLDAGKYIFSYWKKAAGVWSYISTKVDVVDSTFPISLNEQVDDIRFYPVNAQMTTYTHDPLIGMTSMTDTKSQTTYYEYDPANRLLNIKDNDGNIIKNYQYNYKHEPTPVFWNVVKKGTFTKACTVGAGSLVEYVVPEHTYSAATQDAADALAQADVNANGQANANANGICTPLPFAKMVHNSSYQGGPDNHTYGIYTFSLYTDANGTIPFTATTAVNVKYRLTSTTTTAGGSSTTNSVIATATVEPGTNSKIVYVDEDTCGRITVDAVANKSTNVSGRGVTTNTLPGGGGNTTCTSTYVTLITGTGYDLYVYLPE